MEIINEASEKFREKQDEICGVLLDLLGKINALEREVFGRSEELVRQKLAAGIPKHQVGPGEEELWDEYKERLSGIVEPACTAKLLKRGYGGSYGNPAKYGYIDGEVRNASGSEDACVPDKPSAAEIHFIMKTAKKAVVEAHYERGIKQIHKFVLRDMDGKWLVDEVYYGFESNPDKWYVDSVR